MQLLSRQRGMGAVGWSMSLGLFVMVVVVLLRVIPVYIEHSSLLSALHGVSGDDAMTNLDSSTVSTREKVLDVFQKRLYINDIQNIDMKNDVTLESDPEGYKMKVEYQRKVHLGGNVDLLFTFSDTYLVIIK